MRRQDTEIPMPDGTSRGTLHIPDGDDPRPGVLVFPDAGGVRETFRQLADRLAGLGYVVLVPDIYYRAGAWKPYLSGPARFRGIRQPDLRHRRRRPALGRTRAAVPGPPPGLIPGARRAPGISPHGEP